MPGGAEGDAIDQLTTPSILHDRRIGATGQRGAIRLWDVERRQNRVTLLTSSRIYAINAAERARVEKLQVLFRRLGLDHLVLRRDLDVYPELAKLARWRRRRRN